MRKTIKEPFRHTMLNTEALRRKFKKRQKNYCSSICGKAPQLIKHKHHFLPCQHRLQCIYLRTHNPNFSCFRFTKNTTFLVLKRRFANNDAKSLRFSKFSMSIPTLSSPAASTRYHSTRDSRL